MDDHWYLSAFGADYLERYAHRDNDEAARVVGGVLARAWGDGAPGIALDLCCGGGRHLSALAGAGWRAVGLDLSWDLLRAAQDATAEAPALVRGDMRSLPFATGAFDLVVQFFTAFGYFQDDMENLGVFDGVARVLRPGGIYVFDFLSAPLVRAQLDGDVAPAMEEFDDGSRLQTERRISVDGRRVEKVMRRVETDGRTTEQRESVRLFAPADLRLAMASAGLAIEQEWGGYDLAPYAGASSSRWMVAARRRDTTRGA